VVSDQNLAAGLFTPVSTEVDAMNLECYIHSEDDLPKEEEEEGPGFGDLLLDWFGGGRN